MIDNISPERKQLADTVNGIERWRDPSHVRAYSVSQWGGFIAGAGLELRQLSRWAKRKDFIEWAQFVQSLDTDTSAYLRVETKQGEHIRKTPMV